MDLTSLGSRNIGATNAFRVLGPWWGALVLVLDCAKGALAALAPRWLFAAAGEGWLFWLALAGGVSAVLGHTLSPWLRFRGGKGVATSLGLFLAILPLPTLLAFGLWIALFAAGGFRVSVGSIGAALVYPVLVWFLGPPSAQRGVLTAVAAALAVFVVLRHRENIRRILAGTEQPILGRREGGAK